MKEQRPQRNTQILIIGYSTRAATQSAFQAGYSIDSIDYFGDSDQLQWGNNTSFLHDFLKPFSIQELVTQVLKRASTDIIYTANLENFPDSLDLIGTQHNIIGNTSTTLRKVRDWRWLKQFCNQHQIKYPETHAQIDDRSYVALDQEGWLRKPERSGGGRDITPWDGKPLDSGFILQQRIPGIPISIQFLSTGSEFIILDIAEQLIGIGWNHAKKYTYSGNLLPFFTSPSYQKGKFETDDVHEDLALESRRFVSALIKESQIKGLNGIDCILNKEGLWLIEVNPRPTALIDLLDLRWQCSSIHLHYQAVNGHLPQPLVIDPTKPQCYGKAVVYAHKPFQIPFTNHWLSLHRRDIPRPGTIIQPHQPICTVLAWGKNREETLIRLRMQSDDVYSDLA